ncbi:MAG: hypothetical protein Q9218_005448 [Villophora microphyllina]
MAPSESLNKVFLTHWALLERPHATARAIKAVNGRNLDIVTVVLVSRQHLLKSYMVIFVRFTSSNPHLIKTSGIKTGFGGSANTRTKAADKLKEDLVNGLQYGIISEGKGTSVDVDSWENHHDEDDLTLALPLSHETSTVIPESWVRASILYRLNSLSHGASGVTPSTIEALLRLLECNVIPRVPLRRSISASGDLSPLAYIAGVLEGKPSLSAYVGGRNTTERRLERADVALNRHSITPTILTAREGLALVNGTSVSAAAAAERYWHRSGDCIVTSFTLSTYPNPDVWGGTKSYALDQLPALFSAMSEYQNDHYKDPYANVDMQAFTTNATVGVFLNFVYFKPEVFPSVYSPFYSIPTVSDNTKLQTYTQMLSGQLVPSLPRFDWYATTFRPSNSTYPQIESIVTTSPEVKTIASLKSGTFGLALQPISASAVHAGNRRGGNALGLQANPQTWFALDTAH